MNTLAATSFCDYQVVVRPYTAADRKVWDNFVLCAKNGHFFFQRDYMEYHADRFNDYSLLFLYGNELIAILPANREGDTVYSHQGLTYGGLITGRNTTSLMLLSAFSALLCYLQQNQITKFYYKTMPYIFFDIPAEEDRWALFNSGARLVRRDLSSVLCPMEKVKYFKGKQNNLMKAGRSNLTISVSTRYDEFMALLTHVLLTRHEVEPVHTAAEMQLLAERFPENIKLYVCCKEDVLLAGAIVFINRHVVHTQYLANSDQGRQCGALDYLLNYLITDVYVTKKFFSFGISTEADGKVLNSGLLQSKEGFGARGLVHDLYLIEI